MQTGSRLAIATIFLGFAVGCAGVYYDTLEQFGVEKRHILADRVEEGREDQQDAQEQFQTTFDAFQALTHYDGGNLESVYRRLQSEFEDCEDQAQTVRDRISSIENVASDLFSEWEMELAQISDASMRSRSRASMNDTRRKYGSLIAAMKRASRRMDPVLTAFRDRVLYLKHNLNASAIASLEGDLGEIESDVGQLIAEMNKAIAEADAFLGDFE
jgi:hypothetical protein